MNRRPHRLESERPPSAAPEASLPHFVVSPHHAGLNRVAKAASAVLGTGIAFVGATATGLLLHLGSPPARRLVSSAVNGILSGTFRGKIAVIRLASLQRDGLDGAAVTLTDPEGNRVALLEGVHARISLFPLLASILSRGDLKVRVTELSIDHVDAYLTEAADGSLTVAEAFQPAEAGPPRPPKKESGGLDLSLPKITLKHAWVHGGMKALPLIDGDIDDVAASFGMSPERTAVALERLTIRTRSLPRNGDVDARLDGRMDLPSAPDGKMTGAITLGGTVGGIDLSVHGSVDGKQVDGIVDVPQVTPAQLAKILGTSPLHAPASAHIEAHGALPRLEPVVHLTVGKGTVDLHGKVTIPSDGQTDTFAELTLAARDLDARVASPTSPASKLGLDASAKARISADGAADGTYEIHVLPGTIGPQMTPDARVAGTFAPTSIRGTAHVSEPGVPSDLRFDLNPVAKGGPDLSFDAAFRANDLAQVPQLGHAVRGRAIVHASGNVALGAKQIRAHLESSIDQLAAGANGVEHAELLVAVAGELTAPRATATIAGSGLHAGGYSYPLFSAKVEGTPRDAHVTADVSGGSDAHIVADANVSAGTAAGSSARDIVVTATKAKDAVTVRVASATSGAAGVDVVGIRVEGAGDPLEGEMHLRSGTLSARLSSGGMDVPTLLRVAGVQTELRTGVVGLDVDLKASKRTTSGHANVALEGVTYADAVRGLDAKLDTSFDGERATVHLDARDAAKNTVALDTENVRLAGGALDPRAWKEATGRAHARVDVDLQRVHEGANGAIPLEELRGRLAAKVDLERDSAKKRPTVILDAATQHLRLTTEAATVPNGDGTVSVVGRAFHSNGLDGHVKASFDAETGATAVDVLLRDKGGELVEANASTTLPMEAILAGGSRTAFLDTKVRAHVQMPLRSLGDVPVLLASIPVRGEVGLTLDVEGTARAPHVQALVHARNITDADDPSPIPLGVDLAAIYDGDVVRAKVLGTHGSASVLDLNAAVALKAADVVAGALRWEANADATLTKFPVGAVTGFFDENQIDADLSGTVALHDLHKAGALDVKLALERININGTKFGDTTTAVTVRDGSLKADAKVAQLDGSAAVHVEGGMGWGDALAPALDDKKPIDVALKAKNFRLGMLAPFVRSAVSELDGRLNADTTLHVLPGMKDGAMNGAILLDKGLFETPALGEEFHNLRARIFMKPWGIWNVAEVSADGTSGHFTASALAKLDGFHFRSGEAHLGIAERDKLPLAMQGMELGTVWGKIDTKAALASDGKTIDIDVSVPNLHIGLPQSIAHGVQSTTPDPTIKVGAIQSTGIVALLPVDGSLPPPKPPEPKPTAATPPPLNLHVVTHLGPDLEIRRDTMLRAYLSQGPTIDIGKETKISGELAIPRGYIELQGKRFQIEKGVVKFTGQPPDDPVVLATASYEAQDGTKVFADFVGPAKTGKLTLRSEPALSQNEILALLLFGTADGTFGQSAPPGQQGNGGTQAASLAGGVVTQGLNKAISGVSGVEVQTKVDTQESGDPRPEVEVALSRDVSATVIYNLGVPPPGQNPDDTLLVVDWRFHRNYSTEATLGDKGTSILDLTWKYRY